MLDLLLLPTSLAGAAALPVLLNDFGPALARAVFGPPREMPGVHGAKAVFDAAYTAEAVTHWVYGTIPPLQDIARSVNRMPGLEQEDL